VQAQSSCGSDRWGWGLQIRRKVNGLMAADGEEVIVSRCLCLTPWMMAIAALLVGTPAGAQGNIDAGKSPAQIFSDTCAACHRSPGQVRRASASFLRSHYTTGPDEASAMARYLASIPSEPRTPKRQGAAKGGPSESSPPRGRAASEPKEQPKSAVESGRHPAGAEPKSSSTAAATPAPEVKPPEPPHVSAAPPPPPPPRLQPFEE
jgi:hypothetical protein